MAQVTNQVFYATTYHPIQAGSIDGTDTAAHDNAVYRALLASSTGLYDPLGDLKAEGDPYCMLFVGRLARHTTEETLKLVMSRYGKVKHIRLVRHIVTGASQGYAFVEFETEKEMLFAYEAAHYNVVDGSQIIVDYNRQQLMPGWIPRRLGGGLGGRKESGQLRFGGRDRPFRAPLRPIPEEELIKLGIPLPPVGRYMSRFLVPPVPRRPNSARETHRYRSSRKDFRRGTSHHESKVTDKRVMERVLSQSPEKPSKGGEEPGDETNLSSRHKKGDHAVDLDGGSYDLSNRVRRYDGEKSHRHRKDYLSEAVDNKDYNERVRRHDAEKSRRDRKTYVSEAADEKDDHERARVMVRGRDGEKSQRYRRDYQSVAADEKDFHERARGHDGEKSQRYRRDYQSEAADEKDFRDQRYSFSETSTARYDTNAEQDLRSPGYEGRSKSSHSQERREGRRSLSRENTDYQKRSEEYERSTSKHSHEKRERKRSRSRERGDDETRTSRYEEDSSKSRHGHEGRERKRSHSKQKSGET